VTLHADGSESVADDGRGTTLPSHLAHGPPPDPSAVRVRGAARVNQTSARIVAVASYSLVVTPSEGLTGAPPGQV
jgi:hypothetical protein